MPGMSETEIAEWNRRHGGGTGQMTHSTAGEGKSEYDITGYTPDAGASQASASGGAGYGVDYADKGAINANNERLGYNTDTNASRGQQGNALGMLRDAAMGNAPSRAELLSRRQMDQAASAQGSLAASARGPAALAMAQQQAAGNTARSMSDISSNTSAMRADEMARARDSYMSGASGMRGQDQARANEASQRQLGMMGEGRGWGAIDQQGRQADARLGLDAWNASNQNRENIINRQDGYRMAQQKEKAAIAGTVMQTAGTVAGAAAMSDVRAKENIQPVPAQSMEQYLATLSPASYNYNAAAGAMAGAPAGQQIGPASAQDIASTQVGQNVIEQRPDGMLAINGPAAIKAGMSADAHINDKASRAEAKSDAALRSLASLTAAPTVVSAKPNDEWLGSYLASIGATNNVKGPR